jgi:HK97 family phage portal protein
MGLFRELRSSLENPQTPLSYPAEWLLDIFNGGRTDSGIRVSEMTALQVADVNACCRVLGDAVGSLPVYVKEREITDEGRVKNRVAHEHYLYDILASSPNPEMTSFTLRKTAQIHALLWGNAYVEIQRDASYRVVALWPRNPARCRPRRASARFRVGPDYVEAGELYYTTTEGIEFTDLNPEAPEQAEGPERSIIKENMVHVPGLALDGRLGQSTVWLARQVIGLALATEKFGAKFFGNGARPSGILTYPGKLKQEDREQLKKSWQEAQGGENAGRVAVLENQMTWTETSTKPNDGQFLETRQFQRGQLCAVFGVPPHMIGDTEHQNRANTEQIGIEFVTFTLNPWLKSWEQQWQMKLFPSVGRSANKYFATFDTSTMTMPDAASRKAFNDSGKQWGWLSTNDIREREGLNPVDDPDADALWMPVNMQKLGADVSPEDLAARALRHQLALPQATLSPEEIKKLVADEVANTARQLVEA